MTWTFSITGSVATATSDGAADTLDIAEVGGNLYHSTDGVVFSPDWSGTGTTLPASSSSTLNIDPTAGANAHVINLGLAALSPAAAIQAQVNLVNGGANDSLTIDDSTDASAASGADAYAIDAGAITTPLGIDVQASGGALGGGITLKGGGAADTYTVAGTRAGEPITLIGNNAGGNTFDIRATSCPTAVYAGSGAGNAVQLGDATHAASTLADVTVAGTAGLTIDDSADATPGQSISVDSQTIRIGDTAPVIDDSGASLSSAVIDAGSGGTAVTVHRTPEGLLATPMVVNMGAASGNTVQLGNSEADSLGEVTLTGSTGLTVDDSNGSGSWTIAVKATSIGFSAGATSNTFNFCQATLSSLSLSTDNSGGNAVDVTGTPALPPGVAMQIGTLGGSNNSYNLGDATHAAAGLGSINLAPSGDGTSSLTVDDSGGAGGGCITVDSSAVTIGSDGPRFDYSGGAFAGVTLDASDAGSTTVKVKGSPAAASGLAPITLAMGTGTGNSVVAGYEADTLGDVAVTTGAGGSAGLTIDDTSGSGSWAYGVTATAIHLGGGPTFTYGGATLSGLGLNTTNSGGDTVDVTGTPSLPPGSPLSLSLFSGAGDAVNLGDATHAAAGLGSIAIGSGSGAPLDVTIDDSAGAGGASIGIAPSVSFGPGGPTFDLGGAALNSLTLDASALGTTTVRVTGSPAGISGPAPITLAMGGAANNGVVLGGPSNPASGLGGVTVTGTTGLTVDDSADWGTRSPLLQSNPTTDLSELTGLSASTIAFDGEVTHVSLVPSSHSCVATTLTVDFSRGNPLPAEASSSFDFAGPLGGQNTLVLQGALPASTPFDSEVYSPAPNQPGSGVITFQSGPAISTLDFGGLIPIIDTVAVNRYTFAGPSTAQVVDLTGGPTVGPFTTETISSGDTPSAFERVDFANKSTVLVDLSAIANPTYLRPPATPATGLEDLAVKYFSDSTSGHTLDVDGTTPGTTTTVVLGGTGNTLVVKGVTAGGPLVIANVPGAPGGVNAVSFGDGGSLAGFAGDVTIFGPAKSTDVTVDGSAAASPFGSMLLKLNAPRTLADLTGMLPGGTLAFDPAAIHSFALSTGTGADLLAVDFVNGNPFLGSGLGSPSPSPYTLSYNAGGGGDALAFLDSAGPTAPIFNGETYVATGPGSGMVSFSDGTSLAPIFRGGVRFSDLTPTTDSTPVTNYTFTPDSSVGTIAVADGPTAGSALISDPSPSPSFESVAYSNKTNVTIDDSAASRNTRFVLNNPTAAAGQASLAVKLGGGSDTVLVSANPAGVAATIDGGVGSQAVTVAGAGLAAGTTAANLAILGGTGPDTLRLNAQGTGSAAALTPGTTTAPAVAAFGAGAGRVSMAFTGMNVIQDFATNHAPTLAIATPPPALPARPGLPLNDVPVATFTDADLIETAASYQATITWGDGSAPTTGTITADPGTPGRYIISGSHTYRADGNDAIGVTLTDLGGTFNSTLADAAGAVVPVATQLDAIAAVGGGTATASVAGFRLDSTSARRATAGTAATGTLAAFSNANGPADPAAYYALVNWGDGTGLAGAEIVADPHLAGAFDILGTHTYAAPGAYAGTIELVERGTGQGLAIPLRATAQAPTVRVTTGLTKAGGVPTGPLTVATVSVPSFLGAPGLDYRRYTASVDYGDGSPTAAGTPVPASVAGATAFGVTTGGHVYAAGGTFTLTVAIRDGAGVLVGTGRAPVRVTGATPPHPSAPVLPWGRLSPQSDSGVSHEDGITNVTTPTFVGGATPGAVIRVYATSGGPSAAPVLIASGVADAAGAWSATVVRAPMADGSYRITARATAAGGAASKSLGTVVIDTVAPVITGVAFDRLSGELDVSFRDNLSGVFLPDLTDGANYQLSATPLNGQIPVRKVIIPTGVRVTPGATPRSVAVAAVSFDQGQALRGGHYTAGVSAAGITDLAGNRLDGRFYGSYPTGAPGPGGDYVALFTALPRRTLGAFPIRAGTAKPQPAAANRPDPGPASLVDRAIAALAGAAPGRGRS